MKTTTAQGQKADEEQAAEFLRKYDLDPVRFNKAEQRDGTKKPDFRVLAPGGNLLFYCEVKSLTRHADADPIYFSRIADHINTAVDQFDSVNPRHLHRNVLFWVCHEWRGTVLDLKAILTGVARDEHGRTIFECPRLSEGKIKEKKTRVDLHIWLDCDDKASYVVTSDYYTPLGYCRFVASIVESFEGRVWRGDKLESPC